MTRQLAQDADRYTTLGMRLRAAPPIGGTLTVARGSSDHAASYFAYLAMQHVGRGTWEKLFETGRLNNLLDWLTLDASELANIAGFGERSSERLMHSFHSARQRPFAQWLKALEFVTTDPRGEWELDQFDALIAQNKRDFEARFAKSRLLIAIGQWEAAMDELLEIIMRDKKWDNEAPRKTFVALLELMTPPKSKTQDATGKSAGGIELMGKAALQEDPHMAMISSYRRKLSMALN